jgi:TusA-related sulfurtransferase
MKTQKFCKNFGAHSGESFAVIADDPEVVDDFEEYFRRSKNYKISHIEKVDGRIRFCIETRSGK